MPRNLTALVRTPLTPQNIQLCRPLWADRLAYSEEELTRALAAAAVLLGERRALGALLRDGHRVRGFGITTFVDERFAEEFLANPHPQIGKRLLLDTHARPGTVLDLDGIAARNAHGGLQVVVVNANVDTTYSNIPLALGRLMQAFLDVHRGYRIARIIDEQFVESGYGNLDVSGFDIVRVFEKSRQTNWLRSVVGALSRETAVARNPPLLAVFGYEPPQVRFTKAEQDLLRIALLGGTDETQSLSLGIPVNAVKARWTRIQQRALARVPELFRDVPGRCHPNRRGAQRRHLILEYVRANPSELTPFDARAAQLPALTP